METEEFSCCFTGYRPDKLPFKMDLSDPSYVAFENGLTFKIAELIRAGCTTFYCGMAMGFDLIAAESVLIMSRAFTDRVIRLVAVIPFIEQAASFPSDWKERYDAVLGAADSTVLISDKYFSYCFQKRNRYLVDNSDIVLTYFDGQKGGTATTLKYAEKKGRKIINLYDEEDG